MENQLTPQPPFVGFYSFKGGIGRTMSMANVACILAGRGRRVLCIDLDLEAPGLTYLAVKEQRAISRTPGFVDLIYDLLEMGSKAPVADSSKPLAFLEYTHQLPIPRHARLFPGGELRIMPAGRMDDKYEDRLHAVNLGQLYRKGRGKPILVHIRNVIATSGRFDYVLIDSRTGFSDESGVCVRDLADYLVVLLGLNRQNVAGTVRFLKRLKLQSVNPKGVEFVASPIPLGEDKLRAQRVRVAQTELRKAWGKPSELKVFIPYHPRLALDEEPFIFRWSGTELYRAYAALEADIRGFAGDTAADWFEKAQELLLEGRHQPALAALEQLHQLDSELARMLLDQISQDNLGNDKFTPYLKMLHSAYSDDPDVMLTYGRHLAETGRAGDAVKLVERARNRFAKAREKKESARADFILGGILADMGYSKRSEACLTRSLLFNRRAKDKDGIAGNLRKLGELRLKTGPIAAGLRNLQEAADLLDSISSPKGAGLVRRALGIYYQQTGRYDEALAVFQRSLQDFSDLGKAGKSGVASNKHAIAGIYQARGEYDLALALYQECLKTTEELGDRRGVAAAKHAIAGIYQARGEYDRALALYQESLKTAQELGDRRGVAPTKQAIADIYRARGDYDRALALYQENLKNLEEIDDRRGVAAIKPAIADIYKARGESDRALALYQESLKILEELGDRPNVAAIKHALGGVYEARGEYDRARALYKESFQINEELGRRRGVAVTKYALGGIHEARGEYDQALALYQESLKTLEQLGDRQSAAVTKHSIGDIYEARGEYDRALALYQESLRTKEELGDRRGASTTKHAIADVHAAQGEYDRAMALYQESLKTKEKLYDPSGAAVTTGHMGFTLVFLNRPSEGIPLLESSIAELNRLNTPRLLAHAQLRRGMAYLRLNNPAVAQEALRKAQELASRLGARHILADATVLLGQFSSVPAAELDKAREYYRAQNIHTQEASIAEKLIPQPT